MLLCVHSREYSYDFDHRVAVSNIYAYVTDGEYNQHGDVRVDRYFLYFGVIVRHLYCFICAVRNTSLNCDK